MVGAKGYSGNTAHQISNPGAATENSMTWTMADWYNERAECVLILQTLNIDDFSNIFRYNNLPKIFQHCQMQQTML